MKNTLLILLLCITKALSSQSLTDYIPQNASYIFSIHFGQLNAKSNQLEYTKYLEPFIKERHNHYYSSEAPENCNILSVKDVLKAPSEFGVDLQTSVFIYTTSIKEVSGTIYLFRLAKPENFEARLNLGCSGKDRMMKRHAGQAVIYVTERMSVAINGNVATIFSRDHYNNYYSYDYEETISNGYADSQYLAESAADNLKVDSLFYERLNSQKNLDYEKEKDNFIAKSDTGILFRAKQREEARQLEILTKKFNAIFDLMEKIILPQQQNMTSNRNFMKIQDGKHDAFVFTNVLATFNSEFMNPFRWGYRDREEPDISQAPKRLLTADMNSSYTIDFENGKATMNIFGSYNKNVYAYMEKAYDVKQDKALYKYIDAENLLGYMSGAVNAKELAKFYEAFYMEMLENFPKKEYEGDIVTGIQLFYAILDKEVLFNTLDGRSIFACTGFADIKVKYTTYDYDDDYKKSERTEERIEKQPKMVLAAAIGNKENAKRMFELISHFSVFTKLKENVFVFYGNRYTPINVYFALTDDALIVTNDANLVLNHLKGFPKNRQMPKSEQKFISKHNLVFKVYGQKMMEGIKDTYFRNGEDLPWFTQLMTNLGNLEMYDNKPTESGYQATAVITLKDTSSNALYQLLKMMSAIDEH